jgi:hypothetical protein
MFFYPARGKIRRQKTVVLSMRFYFTPCCEHHVSRHVDLFIWGSMVRISLATEHRI